MSLSEQAQDSDLKDKDLFENDLESIQRAGHFSQPLGAIDTQNRIWVRIISHDNQPHDTRLRRKNV